MNTHTPSLSSDEVDRFHREGFLGPFELCSRAEMSVARQEIDCNVLPKAGPDPRRNEHARHLDSPVVFDLIANPNIVQRLNNLLGEDVMVWSSNFWNKEPGGPQIPWHQDIFSWPIEPWVNITCWIAIDDVNIDNSCVQLVPGSHRRVTEMVPPSPEVPWSSDVVDPGSIDGSDVVDMELSAGQFFFFNERMLHHSNSNNSARRRLGLAARYTTTFVKLLDQDGPPLFKGHRCVLLSGVDRFGLNRTATPRFVTN